MSISKTLIALSAAAMLLGASLSANAMPPPPPPGAPGFHHPGGPGFRPGPGPGFRPAPPPPRPYRHHRPWYRSWGFWGPALTTGIVVGAITYPREPRVVERIVEVPVPAASGGSAQALPSPSYPWYWCSSEQGYYPTVRSCPLGWETVMGASPTTPPAPPQQ